MIQTAISLTQGQYEQLKTESEKTGVSLSGLIRLAVGQYFLKQEGNQ